MISSFKIKLFFIGALLFTLSCDGEFDSLVNERLENNPVPDTTANENANANAGSADFSNFITIGNSLTAGFMDAALYNLGQNNSLGAQIAAQLAPAGAPGTFNQPDINSERGFNTSVVPNPDNLGRFKLDTSIPGPSPTVGGEPIGNFSDDVSLDNYAVPGILLGQLLTPATGSPQTNPLFNPFYQRFASAPGSSTILSDAVASEPTFFTLWIGNNDVLAYALSGATQDQLLTDTQVFQQQFGQVINTLMETNASGVVGTIPPVLGIPFFQAVPYNSVVLDSATADSLNQGLSTLNAVYDGMAESSLVDFTEEDRDQRAVSYEAGANPVLIKDPDLEDIGDLFDLLLSVGEIDEEQRASLEPFRQARPMVVDDQVGPELLTLSAASVLGTLADPNNPQSQIGVVIPLEPQFHLTASKIVEIETARQTFNAMIKGTVDNANQAQEATRLGIYDANAPDGSFADLLGLSDGQPGIEIQGTMLQPDFSPNGVFSTDGIHPNPRGNALLANEFIRAIEETFEAEILKVDVLRLPSVQTCDENKMDCVSQLPQGKVVSGQAQRILPGNLFK